MAISTRVLRSASAVTAALTLAGWGVASAVPSQTHVTLTLNGADAVAGTDWSAGPQGWPAEGGTSVAAAAVEAHFAAAFEQGDLWVPVTGSGDGVSAIAAVSSEGASAAVVVANSASNERIVTIDASAMVGFELVDAAALTSTDAESMRTSEAESGADGVTFTADAASVTTLTLTPTGEANPPSEEPRAVQSQRQAPTATLSKTDESVLGEAEAVLIESNHAAGKVLEIGNVDAEPTAPGGTTPAAAASFTMSKVADELMAQTVLAYPVLGAEDTFVFTNSRGEVLSRRDNSDPDFRFLTLTDQALAQAAADPYSQWSVVSAGGDWSYIQNVQRYQSGQIAGLDMYNWANEDAAEIQTYDAGTANVQKWKMHSLKPVVGSVDAIVTDALAPKYPKKLTAAYSFGVSHTISDLTWDAPDAAVWSQTGTVTVSGAGSGFFGEPLETVAKYTVGSLGGALPATMSVSQGSTIKRVQMSAPLTVERPVEGSDRTVTAPVTWDWASVTTADLASPGTIEVLPAESLEYGATLTITVLPATTVNLLRNGAGYHFVTPVGELTAQLFDGNRDNGGFSNWKSGGAANRNNPGRVSVYFDEPQVVTGAGLFALANNDQNRNIGAVRVQYRDLIGGWKDVPSASTWPVANTDAALSFEFEATEPVQATALRVMVTHKSNNTWMGLSELEIYGPMAVN